MHSPDSDLAPAVEHALEAPDDPERGVVTAAGIPFATARWGRPADPPVLLVHGVTASSEIWWRVGPAIAAGGFAVTAIDLPGHGRTGHWQGGHRFADNAAVVAACIRAAGLDVPGLGIVGHSWGAMTAAELPAVGIRPRRLVLLDPPALPQARMAELVATSTERGFRSFDHAVSEIGAANPAWSPRDVDARARALLALDERAARAVLLDNGDWDGGLAALSRPEARGITTWIVRADPAAGGYLPDAAVPPLAALVGADHVVTIPGAEHGPQRRHARELVAILLRALA